jgi:hypothetical protein
VDRAGDPSASSFPITVPSGKPQRNQFFKEKLSQAHISLSTLAELSIPMYEFIDYWFHLSFSYSVCSIRKSGSASYDQESEHFVECLFANKVPLSRATWYLKVLFMSGQNYDINKRDRV